MKLHTPLVYALLACVVLVIAPHAAHLPLRVSVPSGLLLGWRIYLAYSGKKLPPRWLLLGITAVATAEIIYTYHTLFGRDAGVALLIILTALKTLELRAIRDANLVILLSFFIIVTNFFFSQSIPTALYMLFTMLVILTTWLQLHTGALFFKPRLHIAAVLLLQAVPLAVLLFVLFPRIQGPLWGVQQNSSSSGLSDNMSPGTLSKLSLSQEVAFRVNFEGIPPARERMYWRGPVLWDFDGVNWTAGSQRHSKLPQFQELAAPIDYTVTLEPHSKNWLFALEMPTRISVAHVVTDDFQIHSRDAVNSRLRYKAHSQLNFRANVEEHPFHLKRALALPPDVNPRARKLAAEWRKNMLNDEAIIRTATTHFNREAFVYTLEPPLLGTHGVDDFLFETRMGFCEHYASAFVFLMRAANIPARVVTGYQGGEPNELGGYTIVRQSDAHAWAEVWLPEKGWLRIDPTAAISPERVQSGLSAAMPDSLMLPFFARTQSAWLLKMRFNLDLLNHRWNQWVLGYDAEQQFAFLTRLGMEDVTWQKMGINLMIGITLLVGMFSLLLLRKLYTRHRDEAQSLYLKFCRKLARRGIVRAVHEGPMDFAARAVRFNPEKAEAINNITERYLKLRYTGESVGESLIALRREVAAFIA